MARDLLFELGCEEIPARSVDLGIEQLARTAERMLEDLRIDRGTIEANGTPRRLTLYVRDVADRQLPLRQRRRGPAAKAAFDEHGDATKAAEGFARGQGVPVETLLVETDDQGEYVWAVKEEPGAAVLEVLPRALARLVAGLSFPREMRWGGGGLRFVRPVRWIVAMLGPDVVPVEIDGLAAGRTTYGHRFLVSEPLELADAGDYVEALSERGLVTLDRSTRAEAIRRELIEAASQRGWGPVLDDPPFSEVVNLVEAPHVVLGSFSDRYAGLPREVLVTAMESHQRYFPVEDADGRLAPGFLVVHNGDPERADEIRRGHERVLQARLADADFFFAEDRKRPLADSVEQLEELVFQERLGTVRAKAARVSELSLALAHDLGAGEAVAGAAARAGLLAKADLVTDMVVEFPTLQGVMGREYARLDGEPDSVADAIFEHYLPRYTDDAVPGGEVGAIVSIADKMDTIAGCFGVGLVPTGSEDPYALRRSGIGIVRIADEKGLVFGLDALVERAIAGYGDVLGGDAAREAHGDGGDTKGRIGAFMVERVRSYLNARGFAYDRIDAVLASGVDGIVYAVRRAAALTDFMASPGADDLLVGFTRAANLSKRALGIEVDEAILDDAERALLGATEEARRLRDEALGLDDYPAALETLAALRAPVDRFFEDVLVMDEDPVLRENRLRLLNRLLAVFEPLADFSRIVAAGTDDG